MGGKSAKQKAQTGTCGYWPLTGLYGSGFPSLYGGFGGCGLDCFPQSFAPSPFAGGFGGFGGLFGCGFEGLNCGFNGISPLALPYSPFNCAPATTTGKLALTYNGAKFNLKW